MAGKKTKSSPEPQKQSKPKQKSARFQDPTWEDYCADHATPRSFLKLVLGYLKNSLDGIIHHLPSTVIPLVIVYVAMFFFNIYFWSILNDTMWVGRGTVGKSDFAPYLVGGGVFEGTAFKGVAPFDKAGSFSTGTLVAPFTFALGLLIPRLIFRILQKGPFAPLQDFFSVIPLRNHYVSESRQTHEKKQNADLFRTGILCASIAGFLIRNPFAVFVFMLVFFFSFGQGAESQIGQSIFMVKASNRRLHDGRKKEIPYYSDGMMWLYYLAVGFAIYTVLNIILWVLFDYNFYVRLGTTVALAVVSLLFAGKGRKKMVETAVGFVAVIGFFLWLDKLTVYADDNGWSESGRSYKGLTKNGGWSKASKSARTPGISGDTGALMSTLQRYQKFLQKKAAGGEPLSDTDVEVLKRLNQKVRDLKDGKNVSANEVEHLRKLMFGSNGGDLSGNANEQVKPPSVWQDFGTAAGETFEEVARGETPAAQVVRGLAGTLTGGASEVVFTPIQAGYGMYDYVQAGGDNGWVAFGNEAGKVIVGEATNYVTGKAADGVNKMFGIDGAKVFNTVESPNVTFKGNEVKINGDNLKVFSEYRNPFSNATLDSNYTSALGQFAYGAKETINLEMGMIGNAAVNEASNGAAFFGEQSVNVETDVRNFFNGLGANSGSAGSSGRGAAGSSFTNFREGSWAEAAHESGLYGF